MLDDRFWPHFALGCELSTCRLGADQDRLIERGVESFHILEAGLSHQLAKTVDRDCVVPGAHDMGLHQAGGQFVFNDEERKVVVVAIGAASAMIAMTM